MSQNTYSPHQDTLGIVRNLRAGEIEAERLVNGDLSASQDAARERDKLTIGLRSALRAGIPIEELVASTGLTEMQIRQRLARPIVTDD